MYLPLTKKFQSLHFDSIIGQDTAVRILKNSLFLQHFFPVYLFSGQHGCGKTSTARLFATALNCQQLAAFGRDPKISFPCASCASCKAMSRMNHPDFIEIDGASHTGVDTVRDLIESAAFLPILGKYKIYLIDEAHMLSKAACNALLKIFEDTPQNVIFILATTAPDKIIETVRSRSFHLFFASVARERLIAYLEFVAKQEGITYSSAGLAMIADGSRGSVRDALNLLEQVRLSAQNISPETVREVLAWADDELLFVLLTGVLLKNQEMLLDSLKKVASSPSIVFALWERLTHMLRALLWEQFGVKSEFSFPKEIVNTKPNLLLNLLEHLYSFEQLLKKTHQQVGLFEFVLLNFLGSNNEQSIKTGQYKETDVAPIKTIQVEEKEKFEQKQEGEEKKNSPDQVAEIRNPLWQQFVSAIMQKGDPLLGSIFLQAQFCAIDSTNIVSIAFQKEFQFFAEILEESKAEWMPALQNGFGTSATLSWEFSLEEQKQNPLSYESRSVQSAPSPHAEVKKEFEKEGTKGGKNGAVKYNATWQGRSGARTPIRNLENLKYARAVQAIFPGTVTEIDKGTYE